MSVMGPHTELRAAHSGEALLSSEISIAPRLGSPETARPPMDDRTMAMMVGGGGGGENLLSSSRAYKFWLMYSSDKPTFCDMMFGVGAGACLTCFRRPLFPD